MNTKFLNVSQGLCFTLLAVMAFLSSCTAELDSPGLPAGMEGGREVRLELKVPGASGNKSTSRAVDSNVESAVNDLYVLAFKGETDEVFEYYKKAEKSTAKDKEEWKVKLPTPGYKQNFVLIANAEGADEYGLKTGIESLKPGTKLSEVKKQLQALLTKDEQTKGFNAASAASHTPFTMCGQTGLTTIEKEEVNAALTVSLYRITARVQVYLGAGGAGLSNFKPESVRLYNFSDRAQVIPAEPDGAVTAPSVPEGAQLCRGEARYAMTDNTLQNSIYLFETAQPAEGAEDNHLSRPCLVIGGKYDGAESPTYYRVDLWYKNDAGQTEEIIYRDVLRNSSYNVTVTAVTGPGYGTEDEAFRAKRADIQADVQVWDETDLGDIAFDGKNFLGIGTMEFTVGKFGESGLIQTVTSSPGLTWTATLLNENGEGTPDWISFDNEDGTTATGGNAGGTSQKKENVSFTVQPKPEGVTGNRTALMRFKAGNLQVDAKVVQDNSEQVFIRLVSDETVDIVNQDGQTNQIRVEYGPANTELVWVLTQDEEQGIGLQSPYADGTETGGALKNEKTIDVPTNALSVSDKPYVTGKATMMLLARGQNGDAKMVKVQLQQRKLGIELVRKTVYALGGQETVYVRSNFDWTATFDEPTGQLAELTEGFTQDQFEGVATDESNNENAKVVFQMRLADFQGRILPATIKFRSKEDENYECTLNMVDVFEYDNIYYEVSKGYTRTFRQIYEDEYPEGLSSKEGWYLPSKGQALKLTGVTKTATWTNDKSLSDNSPGKNETFQAWTDIKRGENVDHTYEFKANCASSGIWTSHGSVGSFRVYTTGSSGSEGNGCGPEKIPAVKWKVTGGVLSGVIFTYQAHECIDNPAFVCSNCNAHNWPTEHGWRNVPDTQWGAVDITWDQAYTHYVNASEGVVAKFDHRCNHLVRDNYPQGHIELHGELKWTGEASLNTYYLRKINTADN